MVKLAGSVLGICGLIFLSGSPALAGLQEARVLSRNSDGSFLITCENGETETADVQEILDDLVCDNDDPNLDNPQGKAFTCTGNEFMNRFYITRVDNGERLGDNLFLETCRQLVVEHREFDR